MEKFKLESASIKNEQQQPININTNETTINSPPENRKTRILKEIYEDTPVSDEHLQYAMFSSQPTIFEETMNVAQRIQPNEEVNENDALASIDEQCQYVNSLKENLKYIHVFFDKIFSVYKQI